MPCGRGAREVAWGAFRSGPLRWKKPFSGASAGMDFAGRLYLARFAALIFGRVVFLPFRQSMASFRSHFARRLYCLIGDVSPARTEHRT